MSLVNLLKSKSWETQHLFLRLFALEDFDAVYQIYSNFEVMRYIDKGVRTKSEVLVELNSYIKHWQEYNFGPLAVIHKESGKLIGRSGLYLSDRSPFAQLGYVLDLLYHKQGLGVEVAKSSLKHALRN
ncbi:MAG: hypothetical protein CLLPBCKN_007087 [Chroococcidiopsis cubana SAG 39.79]|uniref:N-acetyltransferase domain-containing protein n=1 Tax=Chroococcidiopsis cubana SAG 39.79 TaxID=388085 RepID=A0AB37UBI0_9CYAN|nr:GNAT family N-acetyltransferase [Chroococcidiopsis cubana]MDZ4877652.1 hypothetical protein [Chroococcidiopsis cubana SAG 39.79]PSB63546.1 hypothetical protein C7B79_13435 [Chroococcidiopsis cubana CCALA 043]RUT04550.1 hypothetical protein DSM107010_57300 [Chroococcidiopsis cubana SAG 39.79]